VVGFSQRVFDVYAQRMSASGVAAWTADGVPVCTAVNSQGGAKWSRTVAGGAIIGWQDLRSGTYDLYGQRINGSGAVQWTTDGVAICSATGSQNPPVVVSDGAGNAIVAWSDDRSGQGLDIYAQRMNGTYGYWGHPEPVGKSVRDIGATRAARSR
jgi:hypothetical protein